MALDITQLFDLTEGFDFEAKKAAGRDGKGQLPNEFFPTYSAMANTEGGVVLLGLEETTEGEFAVSGIGNPPKVVKELWDGLNNKEKVSVNILSDPDVQIIDLEGKKVVRVSIPRATRFQMPVYLGKNPLIGTYRRRGEGDYRCDDETVKRMGRGGDAIRTMMIKLNVYTLNEEEWSYQQLFRLWREAGGGGQAVQFDFTGCGFLRQNAVAFLGGLARLIEYRGGQVSFAWDTLGDAVGANLVRIPMISDIQSEIIGQRSDNCRTLVRDCRTVVGA